MMCMDVYCCSGKISCNSYKNDGLVSFRLIKAKVGELADKWNATGIQWIFLLSGSLVVKTPTFRIEINAGEMFLLPVDKFVVSVVTDSELVYFTSDRPTEYCVKMVANLPECRHRDSEALTKLEIVPLLDKYLSLLMIYMESGLDCKYLFETKQQELFMLVSSCYAPEKLACFLSPLTSRKDNDLKKFVTENCSKARNVQELASLCGYSVGGFKRLFKEMFHEPVYRWMLQQKANNLRVRLAEKNVNIKEIINEFGFSSPAHFTKFCKQWLGMVPTEYIKKQQNNMEF